MVRGVHKIYLSAILDLYDRRIVSYVISDHKDNPIVFDTFKATVKANPDAHPLFHSDRGFQYTNQTFHHMLEEAGMTQSMSRVAHCIDNGPMEGFWGILKREKYYGSRFTSKQELVRMILDYIYLLQHPAGTAQSWCCYANGKVPDGICGVKNLPRAVRSWQQNLILFHCTLDGMRFKRYCFGFFTA